MKYKKYYAVFENGMIRQIVKGAGEANKISPAYKGFRTQLEAEEFASWWTYDHNPWKPTQSIRAEYLKNTKARSA